MGNSVSDGGKPGDSVSVKKQVKGGSGLGTSVTLQPAALHGICMRDSVSGKSAVGEGQCQAIS